jgi:hypothetical protein
MYEQSLLWDASVYFLKMGSTHIYDQGTSEHMPRFIYTISYFFYRVFIFPLFLIFRQQIMTSEELSKKHTWLIDGSMTDRIALSPLIFTNNSTFVLPNGAIVYRRLIAYKIVWLIPLLYWLFKKNRLKFFIHYYDVLGMYEESLRLLKKYRPNKLVFACDHVPIQVALKNAAETLGINTYYFQHASVAKHFPPLNFTVSFLDGQDAFDKYLKIGTIKGQVELIGNIKSRSKSGILNTSTSVKKVGIAINRTNKISDMIQLVDIIKDNCPNVKFILRNHPADRRSIDVTSQDYLVSNPKEETTLQFFNQIDLLIAGNSGIHLEAVMLNIVSVYSGGLEPNMWDSYGFIKNGLIESASSMEALIEIINKESIQKSNVVSRAAYYDEYINSNCDYEGILGAYDLKISPDFRRQDIGLISVKEDGDNLI